MDYFDISNQEQPSTGDILISNPLMGDPHFERSIIYLCEHSDEGSLGFVLNKPAKVTLNEVIDGFITEDIPLYIGGPVEQNTLHFIYRSNPELVISEQLPGGKRIREDIYMGGDFESLREIYSLHMVNNDEIKFFIGYSGWSSGQLNNEIEESSWVVVKNPLTKNIFINSSRMHWKDMMSDLGGKYKMMANYPVDPRLN